MKTIGFIGLGLIGGSIARAVKKYHPDYKIYVYARNQEKLLSAVNDHIVDAFLEAEDARYAECDYIFLCAPVEFNLEYLPYLKNAISDKCIITDVGSVKSIIHEKISELHMDSCFIGGHPMAGSEKSGFEYSSDRLIENAYYILTPGNDVPLDKLSTFDELIASIGAIPIIMSAHEHDYVTAGVSHLPHIVASALVNLVNALDNDEEYMKTIAAGGFRDITRIASSSPVMWQQICLENHENISSVLDEFIRMLIQIRCSIDNRESDNLYKMFESSRDYRDSIDIKSNGLIMKSHILFLDIADEAGAIASIATLLAMDKINIKNIGIIHNREFEEGVLKIEFYEQEAKDKAHALLVKRNYIVYER